MVASLRMLRRISFQLQWYSQEVTYASPRVA